MIKGFWWTPVLLFVGLAAVVHWPTVERVFTSKPATVPKRVQLQSPRRFSRLPKAPVAASTATLSHPEGFAWASPMLYRYWAYPMAGHPGTGENAIGDVTGDGRPDLVAINAYQDNPVTNWRAWVYAQTPNGGLAAPVGHSYIGGLTDVPWYYPFAGLAVADFNNDRTQDIAVGYGFGLAIMTADGKGGFTNATYRMPPEHQREVKSMAALDMDHDDDLDLVQFAMSVEEQTLYINDGHGRFAPGKHIRVPGETERTYVDHKILDFDGDGYEDLMVLWGGLRSILLPATVVVYRNTGNPADMFSSPFLVVALEAGWDYGSVASGDFDGDGVLEIVASIPLNQPYASIQFVRRVAGGGWAMAEKLATADIPNSMYAGDVDGDGRDDLAIDHKGWGAISLYSGGDWVNRTYWLVTQNSSSPHIPRALAIGDLNSDGCKEAAVSDNNWDQIVLWAVRCHRRLHIATDSGWKVRAP